MVSVFYQNRALPLCWQAVKAKKSHFSQKRHQKLLTQAQALIPSRHTVIFLGDGEFDGCDLLQDIIAAGWRFVCRTAKNALLAESGWPDETFCLNFACSQARQWN